MTITERSSKAEIISAACEITDHQAATIDQLRAETRILWSALALVLAWQLLF